MGEEVRISHAFFVSKDFSFNRSKQRERVDSDLVIMSRKVKHLYELIILRVLDREILILFLFMISLIALLLNECVDSFDVHMCLKGIVDTIVSLKNVIVSLAISLIAGIIVYFLTVVVPEVRKRRSFLVEIEQTFLHLETSFLDLEVEMQLGDISKPHVFADNAVRSVKEWCHRLSENEEYNLSTFRCYFVSLSKSFNRLTEYLLGYSAVLSEKEINIIIEMRQRTVSNRIMYLYGVDNALSISEIQDYFKEIATLYNDVCTLHKTIEDSIYKKTLSNQV